MNTKKVSILGMIVLTLFIASFASQAFADATVGSVNVVPSAATVGLGQTVTVNVTVTNVTAPGLYSYQLTLTYNNTLLNATDATIPSDHMLKPATAGMIFILDPGTIDQTAGTVKFALTLLAPESGKTGNGTLVTVTFAGLLEGNSTIDLPQADLILVDADTNPIDGPPTGYAINPVTLQVVPEFTIAVMIAAMVISSAAAVVLKKKHK
jgi:hypothetical protein